MCILLYIRVQLFNEKPLKASRASPKCYHVRQEHVGQLLFANIYQCSKNMESDVKTALRLKRQDDLKMLLNIKRPKSDKESDQISCKYFQKLLC